MDERAGVQRVACLQPRDVPLVDARGLPDIGLGLPHRFAHRSQGEVYASATHAKISYVTSETEQREVFLVARRKGPTWYIALVDGKHAALDRRSAQMSNAITSLKVKGVEQESFAGKKANRLDAARLGELDRFIEEAREMTNVPGAAVAVVQGGAGCWRRATASSIAASKQRSIRERSS